MAMDIRIPEDLWGTSLLPEGALEHWRSRDGDVVEAGSLLAEVRIEEALHDILAPCAGRLAVFTAQNAVVEPGTVIGRIESETTA